jgi:hypothetical protein
MFCLKEVRGRPEHTHGRCASACDYSPSIDGLVLVWLKFSSMQLAVSWLAAANAQLSRWNMRKSWSKSAAVFLCATAMLPLSASNRMVAAEAM